MEDLNVQDRTQLAAELNDLLANYQLLYGNVRGFHWNVKGEKFFELHVKFEELYNDLFLKIDELAERILTLGYTPVHSFDDYLKMSEIKTAKNFSTARDTVQAVLDGLLVLLSKERRILRSSGEKEDEGTNALMSDYIREQEKLVWMYKAFLS